MSSKEVFAKDFGDLLMKYWSDENFRHEMDTDPSTTLKANGLDAGDATVTIITPAEAREKAESGGMGDADPMEVCYALWEEGKKSKSMMLVIPESPNLDSGELTEEELMGVAGGWWWSAKADVKSDSGDDNDITIIACNDGDLKVNIPPGYDFEIVD